MITITVKTQSSPAAVTITDQHVRGPVREIVYVDPDSEAEFHVRDIRSISIAEVDEIPLPWLRPVAESTPEA